ncbi:protein FAM92A-B isoform X3 [Xenopus laevis]|uniref:Protein FAM92A-B isoform X3 n=1 Tax=Xenopus laevis TaxID=8355 RepID=A0A8J0VHH2_XENLA|nr:protein FAM92A-B isoform X3 [Xenopus laevis]
MSQTPEARTRDNQTRQIQESVNNVEKHFGELCQIFAGYVRKTARLRDKADLLVREVNTYADTETPTLKHGLKNFADEFAKLQDYRQAEVERLESRVVEPLKSYGGIIKLKREDLKVTLSARNREAKQMAQLEKTRQRNPSDRQIISQAETELQRATMDAARISQQLEETIDNFEKQKIKDIKVFRNSLHPPDFQSRLDIVRANSRSGSTSRAPSVISQPPGNRQKNRMEDDEDGEDDNDENSTEDEN